MPLPDQKKIRAASWRGVEFLLDSVTTEGGQKTVVHEYPNRDARTVESLGILEDVFTVTAIITGTDYYARKKALRNAIRTAGIGEFVHPWDGSVLCEVDGGYSYTETDRTFGEAVFTFKLARADAIFIPETSGSGLDDVLNQVTAAKDSLAEGVGSIFGVSAGFPKNFEEAKSLLESAGDWMNEKRQIFVQAQEEVSSVTRVIDDFTADINALITAPAQLGTRLISLFTATVELFTTPVERFDATLQFFGFGVDAPAISTQRTFQGVTLDAAPLIERLNNQSNIVNTMNAAALAESYAAAVQRQYLTTAELDAAQRAMEAQFEAVFGDLDLSETSSSALFEDIAKFQNIGFGLTEDTRQAFSDLRDGVRAFLDSERLRTSQVVGIHTRQMPVSVLAFQYYGDSARAADIIALNKIRDVSFVAGDVDLLSQ